ncbi:hypothetical protein [Reichenbachiella versicolor]|uniref:hypothetical protein n=1 Tax=Reichenbachiella versicolor TaxID=1821036 RepID=UPI0013A54130|nr:hypothetical protein [Reichenbachiella versicolor]
MKELYSSAIISETLVDFGMKKETLTYPGLTAIVKYPNLKFDSITFVKNIDWEKLAMETVLNCFIKLQSDELVKITLIESKHSVVFNALNYTSSIITIEPIVDVENESTVEDSLSKHLLASIVFNTNINKSKTSLKILSQSIIDRYLGKTKDYTNPEKEFIIRLLKEYSAFPWFRLTTKKKLGGLYNTYNTDIDFNMKTIISEEVNNINTNPLMKSKEAILIFKTKLESYVHSHFIFKSTSD